MAGARKKDFVYDALLERLLTAQYKFGERIFVKEVGEETGVSRQPIMTALSALSSEGFVNIVAQVGCEVVSPSTDDIGDFYLMFERLEGLMAELAATRHTPFQLRRLEEINARIRLIDITTSDASEQYRTLNREFHGLIHDMARSPMLNERQTNIFAMSDFFIGQTVGFVPHMQAAVDEHAAIILGLTNRDPDHGRSATEAHIRAVRTAVLTGLAT